jgi:hypothetical protein
VTATVDPDVAAVDNTDENEPVTGKPVDTITREVPAALTTAVVEPPVAAVERIDEKDPVTGSPVLTTTN